ncbi:MAG: hypothetical protein GX053_11715 [Tissierella sp.]|nr:hypothetical protein [Tissierella sp.]
MKELLNSLRLEEIFGYMEYGKLLAFVFLGAIVVTYICHRFFRGQRWIKYIPGLALLLFGLYSLTQIDISSNSFLEDNSLVGFVTGIAGGLATLLFGLILGVFNKPKKVKKKKENKKNIEE